MSKNPEAVLFGQRVKAKREKAGLTQQQLANRLDLGRRHVQRIEAGSSNVQLSTICQIAKALGVELWVLMVAIEDSVVMPMARADATSKRRKPLVTVVEPERKQSLALSYVRSQRARDFWDEKGS